MRPGYAPFRIDYAGKEVIVCTRDDCKERMIHLAEIDNFTKVETLFETGKMYKYTGWKFAIDRIETDGDSSPVAIGVTAFRDTQAIWKTRRQLALFKEVTEPADG
ncbi:hypothetical protein [Streptomyces sp. NPDC055085]